MNTDAENVLNFWFGKLESETDYPMDKATMWFGNGAAYDEIIKQQFSDLHDKACHKQLQDWGKQPKSLLALVIILDQFSRHLYRNTAQSFAQDKQALELVQLAIECNFDQSLYFIQRKFLYMPLMHAEDITIQNLSLEMFANLVDEVPASLKSLYKKSFSFAQSHHHVIEKFGRFPELNEILGRDNTSEEIKFLQTGKYRFL